MSKIELRMQPHLNYHRVGARPCTAPQSYQAFYIAAESGFALSSPLPTTTSASLVCRPGGHPSWAIFTQQQTLQQRSRPRLGAEHAHKRFWRTDLSSSPSTRTQSFLFMYLLFTGHPSRHFGSVRGRTRPIGTRSGCNNRSAAHNLFRYLGPQPHLFNTHFNSWPAHSACTDGLEPMALFQISRRAWRIAQIRPESRHGSALIQTARAPTKRPFLHPIMHRSIFHQRREDAQPHLRQCYMCCCLCMIHKRLGKA